jgi:uncharacterized protein YaaQ
MSMKLIIAIVQNDDADDLIDALTNAHFGATRLASTGGFLRQGNTTIIVGVPEEAVDAVLKIITQHSQDRRQSVANPFPTQNIPNRKNGSHRPDTNSTPGLIEQFIAQSAASNPEASTIEVQTGRATIFVLNLERYERV